MTTPIPKSISFLTFPGFGGQPSVGLAALDQQDRVILTDAEDNPGTSMTNAIENAVGPASRQLGVKPGSATYLWTPDDPVTPNSLWLVGFTTHGAEFKRVAFEGDDDLKGAVAALNKARGRDSPQ